MAAKTARRDTGRRVGLDRQQIGEAALELIDSEGPDALSMRKLAVRLDVTPMALYNHIEGRADLERLVVDAVFSKTSRPSGSTGTDQVLSQIAHQLRDLYLAHPNATRLIQTVPPTEITSLGLVEAVLQTLIMAGHDIEHSRRIWVGLVSLVNGHVAYELQGHFSDPGTADGLPEELPVLRQALEIGPLDWAASFDHAVRTYLQGIEQDLSAVL